LDKNSPSPPFPIFSFELPVSLIWPQICAVSETDSVLKTKIALYCATFWPKKLAERV